VVVPSSKIIEVLDHPELIAKREDAEHEKKVAKRSVALDDTGIFPISTRSSR
jgi:hypothetical protein